MGHAAIRVVERLLHHVEDLPQVGGLRLPLERRGGRVAVGERLAHDVVERVLQPRRHRRADHQPGLQRREVVGQRVGRVDGGRVGADNPIGHADRVPEPLAGGDLLGLELRPRRRPRGG